MTAGIIVISGPSGVGKNRLIAEMFKLVPGLKLGASLTTREPRPKDVPGKYEYVTEEEFIRREAAGELLESALVHGHWYGTLYPPDDPNIVLEIDVQGAAEVLARRPNARLIMIMPPGDTERDKIEVLRQRLTDRGTDSPEVIERRLQDAPAEIRQGVVQSRWLIINDDLQRATKQLIEIVRDPKVVMKCDGCDAEIREGQHALQVETEIVTSLPDGLIGITVMPRERYNIVLDTPLCYVLWARKHKVVADVFEGISATSHRADPASTT